MLFSMPAMPGTASKGLDDDEEEMPFQGNYARITYTIGKYFKPKKLETANYYKVQKTRQISHVVFFEACRPYQLNREIKANNQYTVPYAFHMAQVIKKFGPSTNASTVINQLNKEITKEGLWPMNQNLVIEKKFLNMNVPYRQYRTYQNRNRAKTQSNQSSCFEV